ncbi:DUF4230 domain-containing protein [Bacteroides sp. OF04-15BH]|nr:DUF4230 domain-containing protein [Bacteroides sp. OF04-15BH]
MVKRYLETDMKKRYLLFAGLAVLLSASACRQETAGQAESAIEQADSATVVLRLQQCSRIYSTEYKIHKIITNRDQMKLEGNIINRKVDMPIPSGTRKIAIPIDVVIKGYTDLSQISEKNIKVEGKKISIILPDPQFAVTAVKIDRKNIAQTAELMRSRYQEQDINRLTRQGVNSLHKDLPWNEFLETARSNAAYTLFPILQAMGFKEIHIQYRDNLKEDSKESLLLFKTIEERKS